jgi:serine/threonine protein kinase
MSASERKKIHDEIILMQKLEHPNIVHFIKAWHNKEKNEVVFITEIMTGGSLKKYLQRMRHPRLKLIKQWCKDILSGLVYLHSQKPYPIIHRDLKCDNIFVCSNTGVLRIGDLGLSTIMRNSHNKSIVGTPRYMAPELFEERYGPSVDIYAFGMCLLEMCTLTPPYQECDTAYKVYRHITSGIKPYAYDKILDDEVKKFIAICLAPVDSRPHAGELLQHKFLIIDEKDERSHRPVPLKDDIVPTLIDLPEPESRTEFIKGMIQSTAETSPVSSPAEYQDLAKTPRFPDEQPCTSKQSVVNISLKISVKGAEKPDEKYKLDMEYDLETDDPQSVAQNIIDTLSLEPSCMQPLTDLIADKVRKAITSTSSQASNESFINVNAQEKNLAIEPTNNKEVSTASSAVSSRKNSFEHKKSLNTDLRSPFSSGNLSPIEVSNSSEARNSENIAKILEMIREKQQIRIPPFPGKLWKGNADNDSEAVRLVQEALKIVMNTSLKVDGNFGKRTEEVLKEYQDGSGLLIDGIVSPTVWETLMKSYERKRVSYKSVVAGVKEEEKKATKYNLEERLLNNL